VSYQYEQGTTIGNVREAIGDTDGSIMASLRIDDEVIEAFLLTEATEAAAALRALDVLMAKGAQLKDRGERGTSTDIHLWFERKKALRLILMDRQASDALPSSPSLSTTRVAALQADATRVQPFAKIGDLDSNRTGPPGA